MVNAAHDQPDLTCFQLGWNIKMKNKTAAHVALLVLSLAGLCSARRWSSPAGRPNRPRHLIFWTNWWDAHLATTLASDPTSKVANAWWRWCSLWGGTLPLPTRTHTLAHYHRCETIVCGKLTGSTYVCRRAACDTFTPSLSFVSSSFRVMCCYSPMLTHSPGV